MSMSLRFNTVADSDIRDIEEDPLKLEILHYGELSDPSMLDDLEEEERAQFVQWTPKAAPATFYVEGMFQSLHYLLTLEVEGNKGTFPLNFLTGRRLDIGEIGWGRATFYTSGDVQQIATALNNLDYTDIEKRYDADFFNKTEIYPKGYKWTMSDRDGLVGELQQIAVYFNDTASKGLGVYRVLV